MKNLSIIIVIFFALSAVSCKKEKQTIDDPAPTDTTSAAIWNLNKTWQMSGHHVIHYHPSNGANIPSYYDTINNNSHAIIVVDDTTIVFTAYRSYGNTMYGGAAFDTLCLHNTDNSDAYIEFIPKMFIGGTRYRPTFLKYYYSVDSIWYFFMDAGVSFHDSLTLFTK